MLLLNPHLIKLTLDDLINQENFIRKILLRERFFPRQIDVSAKYQKDAEKEREEITDPFPRSSSLVWSFAHSTP